MQHGAGDEGQGGAFVQPAAGGGLVGQNFRSRGKVCKDEVPALLLGGQGLVYGDGCEVFVVNDYVFVTLDELEVEPAAHEPELALEAYLHVFRQAGAKVVKVAHGLVGAANRVI